MNTRHYLRLLPFFFGALSSLAPPAAADPVGSAFIWQGQISDSGHPANGVYDLRFLIYDSPTGGLILGTNSVVAAVSNGLYSVRLDFGASVFSGEARWLEFSVRSNGVLDFTTLAPRQQITPTPYAITAANAASALGVSGAVAASQLTGAISPTNIAAGTISGSMLASGAVGSGQLAAGAVTTSALADGAVTAAKIATVPLSQLVTAFTNPTPASEDYFGHAIAAVGNDRVLIGAGYDDSSGANAGIAYLFKTDGTLLTTFTNPAPAAGDRFGGAVAAVGTEKVLIGAAGKGCGVAYLLSTSGALLTTLTNPAPDGGQSFGDSLAALGADRVIISALRNQGGGTDTGVAYLFGTNGALLATFSDPTPASYHWFGNSVVAVGTDAILITAPSPWGSSELPAAFLFNTNGVLLTTFHSPSPEYDDHFATSACAVGNDRVLIGAPWDDIGGLDAGAAYLFHTNGTLLTTFATPTPSVAQYFGYAVAAVGTDRVLIGEPFDETGAHAAGAAHLFTTNGTLLATFTNPKPSAYASFGVPLAAVGTDRILIGSPIEDTGGSKSGAVYLYRTEAESYTPGLIAEGVKSTSIATASIQDGAVTAAKISGPLLPGQIPELDSAKITSGVLGPNRIPALDAAKLTSGTLADARLSANVALLNADQLFTGSTHFAGVVELTNSANVVVGIFSGDGGGLTNLNAAQLTGSISSNNIAAGIVSSAMLAPGSVGASHLTAGAVTTDAISDGAVTSAKIGGALLPGQIPGLDAAGITSGVLEPNRIPALDAAKITSGTVADSRLSANVAMLNADQLFTGANHFAGVVELTNSANVVIGAFSGDGGGLTNLNAAQLTGSISSNNIAAGTVSSAMLAPGAVSASHLAAGAVSAEAIADGAVTSAKIGGALLPGQIPGLDAAGITSGIFDTNRIPNLSAAKLTSGTLADARLSGNVALRAGGNSFTGSQTITGGSVGIGTVSPASTLTVSKAVTGGRGAEISIINPAAQYAGNEAALNFGLEASSYDADNGNAQIKARSMSGSDNRTDLIFSTWNGFGFGERMRVQSDGNVGVGTTTAPARLTIGGSGAAQALAIYRPSLVLDQANEASGVYYYIWGTLTRWQSFTAALPTGGSGNLGAVELLFGATDGVSPWTATMRIYSGVGSGGLLLTQQTMSGQGAMKWNMCLLASPVALASGSNYTIYVTTGVSTMWRINTTDTYAGGVSSADAGRDFAFRTYQTTSNAALTSLAVNSGDGFVGIGTASPASALHIKSASADCEIGIECPDSGGRRWAVQSSGGPQLGAFQIIDRTAGASRLMINTNGNVGIGTTTLTSNRLEVAGTVGATAFNTTSDRAAKQGFSAVDSQAVLASVATLPITQWSFKEFPAAQHLGPTAQDFRAAFGLGVDDKSIATVDADGVALVAIQGLNTKMESARKRAESRMERLEARSLELEAENVQLRERLARLEQCLNQRAGGAK